MFYTNTCSPVKGGEGKAGAAGSLRLQAMELAFDRPSG